MCPNFLDNFSIPHIILAGRTDETSRALEQKREMVDQIQEMQRKVKNEQIGKEQRMHEATKRGDSTFMRATLSIDMCVVWMSHSPCTSAVDTQKHVLRVVYSM